MEARGYDRHTLLLDPHVAEGLGAVLGVETVEFNNQVIPGGIAVGIVPQITAQAVPQIVGTLLFLEFAHHDGCLVVDDVAVQQAGLVHVVQRLLNGVRSLGAVSAHRQRIVGLDESQVVVDFGKFFPGDFVRHEVGKHFLGPHVIKPTHRHQVAEPHVGRLVSDEIKS